MLSLNQIREALQDLRPGRVSEATGVHVNTVMQIRDNPKANPTWRVIKALSDYLEGSSD